MPDSVILEQSRYDNSDNIMRSQLNRRRIYIIPTRQGMLSAAILTVMLLGSINYGSSMGFALCFLLVGLMLLDALYNHRNLSGLVLHSTDPEAVFAGDSARFPITIDNRYGMTRYALALMPATKKGRFWKAIKSEPLLFDVAAGQQHTAFLPQQANQRGKIRLTGVRIEGYFPLGLFCAWSCFSSTAKGIVYPKPAGTHHIPWQDQYDGGYGSSLASNADEFSTIKKYTPGDPIKHIAWKILAKGQGLVVKKFEGDSTYQLRFSWRQVAQLPSIDARLSQLCRWILVAEQQRLAYGLVIPGVTIVPSLGAQHQQRCLAALALFQ